MAEIRNSVQEVPAVDEVFEMKPNNAVVANSQNIKMKGEKETSIQCKGDTLSKQDTLNKAKSSVTPIAQDIKLPSVNAEKRAATEIFENNTAALNENYDVKFRVIH